MRLYNKIVKMGEAMITLSRDNHAIAMLEQIITIDTTPQNSYVSLL